VGLTDKGEMRKLGGFPSGYPNCTNELCLPLSVKKPTTAILLFSFVIAVLIIFGRRRK
jgi:hypothetical protein